MTITGNDGVSILIYGASGIGKTTDVGYTFRNAAWLQTEPGGLIPVIRCVGYTPEVVYTLFDAEKPEDELNSAIDTIVIPGAKSGKIKSVVLDTGSEVGHRMESALGRKFKDGREVYRELGTIFIDMIDRITKLGIWFICVCHDLPPEIDPITKNKLRGGPLLPGRKLPRRLPPKFNLVLHATTDQSIGDAKRVYRCDPLDPDWIMKDRYGVTKKTQPMELAPIVYRILNPGKEAPPELLEKRLNITQ